jgi:isoleucyl-tRNA synthetase
MTGAVEVERREKRIGSSLEAAVMLADGSAPLDLLSPEGWAEIAIVSQVGVSEVGVGGAEALSARAAAGAKCERCWRVLPEVGQSTAHATLCLRCEDAVESGLYCAAVA